MESVSHATVHLDIGDEIVLFPTLKRANAKDFDHKDNVIFIHGFTSHGKYMEKLIQGFHDAEFQCFMFNYNSYRGISEAAETLSQLLNDIDVIGDGIISKRKISFICHSMGGLVARSFSYDSCSTKFMKKMITLGTPHNGTLGNSIILKSIVQWGEHITDVMPGFTKKSCKSAKELLGSDSTENTFLDKLKIPNKLMDNIPVLSVSGGKQWIEVSNNPLKNIVVNRRIARLMDGQNNDGLVSEDSSNLENPMFKVCALKARHYNNYSEYKDINHSNLTQNYALSLKLIRWIKTGNL